MVTKASECQSVIHCLNASTYRLSPLLIALPTITTMPTTSITAIPVQGISALFAFRQRHEAFLARLSLLRTAFAGCGRGRSPPSVSRA